MSRLGGSARTVEGMRRATEAHIHKLGSMAEAVERLRLGRSQNYKIFKKSQHTKEDVEGYAKAMMSGERLEKIEAEADCLIDQVLIEDPRLVRKSAWVRSEDGIDACPALLSQGEENAFLDRRKLRVGDAATLDPVRIVISTDSHQVSDKNAAAWIAAAKLAQQFRPIEVWWQGAWLHEDEPNKGCGHVFLVPLIQGDMDWSRLQFVLSHACRDSVSYLIMFSYCIESKATYGGGVGPYSFLENTLDYVPEKGLTGEPWLLASHAAKWAGLEPKYRTSVSGYEATQSWTDKPTEWKPADEATQKRWEREAKEREKAEAQQAKERLASING